MLSWVSRCAAASGLVKDVDVKNTDARHVLSVCQSLRQQTGRPIRRKWAAARSAAPSLQGTWTAAFNHVEPIEQMRRQVEREGRMLGVAPPLEVADKLPPPPFASAPLPAAAPASSTPRPPSAPSSPPRSQRPQKRSAAPV